VNWDMRARCRDGDPQLFFTPSGRDPQALAECRACPVRKPCLEDALRVERGAVLDTHGIRGGLTAPQRIALWQRRERAGRAFASLRGA
jgi:hypothetical protein